jgi:hypothetical protein
MIGHTSGVSSPASYGRMSRHEEDAFTGILVTRLPDERLNWDLLVNLSEARPYEERRIESTVVK